MTASDHYGVEIQPGCTLAYPVRRGSKLWISHICVSRVVDSGPKPWVTGHNDLGRRVNVHNLANTFVKQ